VAKLVGAKTLDPCAIRADFPILAGRGPSSPHPLVYLDSASSAQRPRSVLDAMDDYYTTTHANVHRGVYAIAEEATRRYELARTTMGRFIGAPLPSKEIVFTKNGTEAINLVARTFGERLGPGDVIVLSEVEHHANLVPWLMLAEARGVELRFLPMREDFTIDLEGLDEVLEGAKLLAITGASNVLGNIPDLGPIVEHAHAVGALVLVDACQLVPHRRVNVAELDVDFLAATGHKMLGPTGIGVLYARAALLEEMPPFLGGGEMISDVRLDGFTTNEIPWKFEAGTPPIAEAVGLGAAVSYLEAIGLDAIAEHERSLTSYAIAALTDAFKELRVFGPTPGAADRSGVISFAFGDVHPHDVAQILDEKGVCVRAGHHCAKPLMRTLGVGATTRASLYLYNDEDDVDALIAGLVRVHELFA
jgi:cysteine desulfurase/selenocysteine lyase